MVTNRDTVGERHDELRGMSAGFLLFRWRALAKTCSILLVQGRRFEFIPIKLSVARVRGASRHDGGRRSMPSGLTHAASKDGTRRCNFSTVTLVVARNAGEQASAQSTSQRGAFLPWRHRGQ